eukprot:CAMPEP_0174293472 /NCGR_PEP_ID=MMETSP0809-20121228/38695_1 /TAXON_ID=73025 ORGANISM="Eutreptiella gymnastica-like, Strain CCMP1594" /NCGR_SAMPLE_ID=MMETSP0809 /ASSEMBLY_ACC=CAM_ASM_000658 /LENGTH=163 /DNA_ID=CAMNT_0015394267 /DNA_START=1046 /DNA_END=1534 /DNA_ORIENTATION=-
MAGHVLGTQLCQRGAGVSGMQRARCAKRRICQCPSCPHVSWGQSSGCPLQKRNPCLWDCRPVAMLHFGSSEDNEGVERTGKKKRGPGGLQLSHVVVNVLKSFGAGQAQVEQKQEPGRLRKCFETALHGAGAPTYNRARQRPESPDNERRTEYALTAQRHGRGT